eukprot:TRINITY_DN2103_c0_g1_i1.p1 TRINITY_DN2103_c0_g1~~TRINITY_DN2103_c0_g1_i1.p1  ORF type:complete len:164 (-),score=5.67 TRINITY_DN2103_c0_g1_i1:363-854(-)
MGNTPITREVKRERFKKSVHVILFDCFSIIPAQRLREIRYPPTALFGEVEVSITFSIEHWPVHMPERHLRLFIYDFTDYKTFAYTVSQIEGERSGNKQSRYPCRAHRQVYGLLGIRPSSNQDRPREVPFAKVEPLFSLHSISAYEVDDLQIGITNGLTLALMQ